MERLKPRGPASGRKGLQLPVCSATPATPTHAPHQWVLRGRLGLEAELSAEWAGRGGVSERSGTWPRWSRCLPPRCPRDHPAPGPGGPAPAARGRGPWPAIRGSCWKRWRCRSATPPSRWRRSWRQRRPCRPRWRSSPPSARRTPGSSEHGATC